MFQKKYLISAFILTFITILSACDISVSNSVSASGSTADESSEDWAQLIYKDNYRVVNNVWNKNAATGPYKQSVYRNENENRLGWDWEWPSDSSHVVSYPEVIYGDKPWDEPSGLDSEFPLSAESADITAFFSITTDAEGVYNMAFSLWAVSKLPAVEENISHEIMIWCHNNGMTPSGTIYSTAVVNDITYTVYIRENHIDDSGNSSLTWKYIAFLPEKSLLDTEQLTLSEFTDYLISESILPVDNYLTSIELGNEIFCGSGSTEISNYMIKVSTK